MLSQFLALTNYVVPQGLGLLHIRLLFHKIIIPLRVKLVQRTVTIKNEVKQDKVQS